MEKHRADILQREGEHEVHSKNISYFITSIKNMAYFVTSIKILHTL